MKISDPGTVIVENISPQLDGGRYPIKRAVGQDLVVEADIFKEGHDVVSAMLKWRRVGDSTWLETPMKPLVNDRWRGVLTVTAPGPWEYTIEAWGDTFKSWQEEIHKKFGGGILDLGSESLEGAAFVQGAASRAAGTPDADLLNEFATKLKSAGSEETNAIASSAELEGLMTVWTDRSLSTDYHPLLPLWVDGELAVFAAWYEFFPRSAEGKPDSGSTFRDCLPRIDDAKAMGFDVIYFPPIHPIGETARKGRNNSVTCEPGEPGVPYAIGTIVRASTVAAIRMSRRNLERSKTLLGWLVRSRSGAWGSPSTSPLIALPIIPTSTIIPSGFSSGRMERSNTRRIRRRNIRTFIR